MGSYSRVAKTGVLWGFLSRGVNEAFAIPTSMVLARLLTPEDFGVGAAAAFFVQIATRITSLGFNTALVQLKVINRQHTATVFAANLLFGVAAWLILTLTAGPLGRAFDSEAATAALPIAALTFLISPFAAVPSALLVRDLRYREATILDGSFVVIACLSSVSLALMGYGYWSLIYSQVIATTIPTIARMWVVQWWPSLAVSKAAFDDLLAFGMGLQAKRLLDSLAQNIDNLVVGRMLGLHALGYYDRAFTMTTRAVNALNSAGPSVSFRILAILSDDAERFRRAYRRLVLTATFIAYPTLALLAVFAEELFDVMFGSQWGPAVLPFRVLCVAGALKFVTGYASTATQSMGLVWGEVSRQLLYLAAIVAGAAVGATFGIVGTAAGVLGATALMFGTMHHYLTQSTNITWRDVLQAQLPATLCAAGLLVLALSIRGVLMGVVSDSLRVAVSLSVSIAFVLAFVRYCRFAELNEIVHETLLEYLPRATAWLPRRAERHVEG